MPRDSGSATPPSAQAASSQHVAPWGGQQQYPRVGEVERDPNAAWVAPDEVAPQSWGGLVLVQGSQRPLLVRVMRAHLERRACQEYEASESGFLGETVHFYILV